MNQSNEKQAVREAVAVFASEKAMQGAIDELLVSGFNQADVSLMASEEAIRSQFGGRYTKVQELEDARGAPREAYVSPESIGDAEGAIIGTLMYVGAGIFMGPAAAAGGGLAAMLGAAAIGGGSGAAIGSWLAMFIGDEHARYIDEQLRRGGLVVWVRIWDVAHEQKALDILKKHSGTDVHIHAFGA
ncbi:MAG: hypothetical protein AB7F96_20690 [Beijerinckiaceae bacterium]